MRKGKSLLGLKVISEVDGTDMGKVKDLIFDHDSNQVLALLMSERELFGFIDAQIIPWDQISHVGPDAITVVSASSRINAGADASVRSVMNRNTALSGTRVYTTGGKDLGTLADTYLDEESGHIEGYEISGGFVSDTVTGKRFLPADHHLHVGRDVALVEPVAAQALNATQSSEADESREASGPAVAAQNVGEKFSSAYDAAREKVADAYAGIASASIEKQQEFVIGKTAAHDVILEAEHISPFREYVPSEATADVTSTGEVVEGEVLVREGEVINREHALRATEAGILGQLVAAAISGAAGDALTTGRERVTGAAAVGSEHVGTAGATLQERAEAAAIGKIAAHEVIAPDGSILVAEGQVVTTEILNRARLYDREKDVIAAAGLGAVSEATQNISQSAKNLGQSASDTAGSLWESARQKLVELTHSAQEKKAEYDLAAEQSRINHALGRPTTRVILDLSDNIILNTGDIITHAAVERSRQAGVLEILLDSVYDATPEITPEMMRAEHKGQAALDAQQEPNGGAYTATVAPSAPPQVTPPQTAPPQSPVL